MARLRVPAGFVLVAAFAWFSRPSAVSLAAGLPVALPGPGAAGLGGRTPGEEPSGWPPAAPTRYTRNPLYIGTLLVAAGLAIAARSAGLAVLFAAVFVLVYLPVIELEEQHLRKLFPEYAAYASRVPALVPEFRPEKSPHPFRMSLYLKNQEYQALVGFSAGALLLVWKSFWV